MKLICEKLLELFRHIKCVDRRRDRKHDYYRAPAFSMQCPNETQVFWSSGKNIVTPIYAKVWYSYTTVPQQLCYFRDDRITMSYVDM